MNSELVGFIGLGLMGHGMAKNIVEKNYSLTVFSRNGGTALEDLVQRGAKQATTLAELAQTCNIVVLCVTGSPQVEEIVLGAGGLIGNLKEGSVVIDCSTSNPVSTETIAKQLAGRSIAFADAPLSRTPKDAWAGNLDTMVGAEEDTFTRIKPLLECWAGKIVHIGGVGDGHRMKLINNFISLGYAALYAEALEVAGRVGLSAPQVDSVIRGGRMDNQFYQTFMRWTLERDPDAHKFTLANAAKDLGYMQAMAIDAGLNAPMVSTVRASFDSALANGGGDAFVPMLGDYISKK